MKRVLIVSRNLSETNGVANCMLQYYVGLINSGFQVDYLLLSREKSEWTEKIGQQGKIFYWPDNCSKYSGAAFAFLNSLFDNNAFDIVHVNVPGIYGALVLKAARNNGIKNRIYHAHNPKSGKSIKGWIVLSIFDPICIRNANHLIACTDNTGKSIFGRRSFRIIRNCINTQKYQYNADARKRLRSELGIDSNTVLIGSVGRLEEQKNPMFALECIKRVHENNSNIYYVWIGKGSLQDKIVKYLQTNNMQEYVQLLGARTDVNDWYSAMDIFFLPSQYEGLGIVFIEAQTSGLVCIGSDQVPIDTEITPLMNRLSLSLSKNQWAEKILSIRQDGNRSHYKSLVDKAGYNTKDEVYRLSEMYNEFICK